MNPAPARLRAEIARKEIPQPEVAAWLRIKPRSLRRRLAGEIPLTLDEATVLARRLGLSLDALVRL